MMVLLRKLADKGHTIVLVTHATNNINVCDYVCFLAQGGRLTYFGSPDGAKIFSAKRILPRFTRRWRRLAKHPQLPERPRRALKFPQTIRIMWLSRSRLASGLAATSTPLKEIKRARRGSFWKQFTLLSLRRLELLKNDVPTLLVLLLQAPLVAVLLIVLIRFGLGPGILMATILFSASRKSARRRARC